MNICSKICQCSWNPFVVSSYDLASLKLIILQGPKIVVHDGSNINERRRERTVGLNCVALFPFEILFARTDRDLGSRDLKLTTAITRISTVLPRLQLKQRTFKKAVF
jgi:hypothetical protein